MQDSYIENKSYNGQNFTEKKFIFGEYERCTFTNCNFSNVDFSEMIFSDCVFENCDLSTAKLKETAFKDVKFKSSKLLGLHFGDCKIFLLSFNFENCILNYASFYKLKIKNTIFKDCRLEQVEFIETDLTNSTFDNCDLHKTKFVNAILENSDFRSAFNFLIDPEINKMRKAKFSMENCVGLLSKYNIVIE